MQTEYGTADVLRVEDIDRPTIGDDEVFLRVEAAGLDRGTWHLMAGQAYLIRLMGYGLLAPKNRVPGLDVAGTVAAVGADVNRFQVGEEVFGISEGSFAEYACAREDRLVRKPANLTFDQAAVAAVSGLTALQGSSRRRTRPTRTTCAGRRRIGRCRHVRSADRQGLRSGGHRRVQHDKRRPGPIDRGRPRDRLHPRRFRERPQRYDLILDIGGNSPLSRLRRALTPRGTLVIVGGEDGGRWTGGMGRQLRALALSTFVGQRLTMVVSKPHLADLERLAQLVEAGELTPIIDKTFPLHEAPDAMRHLVAGHARGKLVITVTKAG